MQTGLQNQWEHSKWDREIYTHGGCLYNRGGGQGVLSESLFCSNFQSPPPSLAVVGWNSLEGFNILSSEKNLPNLYNLRTRRTLLLSLATQKKEREPLFYFIYLFLVFSLADEGAMDPGPRLSGNRIRRLDFDIFFLLLKFGPGGQTRQQAGRGGTKCIRKRVLVSLNVQ